MNRLLVLMTVCLLASCSKWTQPQALENTVTFPEQQHPGVYGKYYENLRSYKAGAHYIVYATLENSPEFAPNEGCFMRCLPDSLDIVSLTNADHFSREDAEDMERMRLLGIKVLYHLDLTAAAADPSALQAAVDGAVATVKAQGLDGWSFTGLRRSADPDWETALSGIVGRLYDLKKADQLLVCEGNPLSVREDDRWMVDYFVLDTRDDDKLFDISMKVDDALHLAGIDPTKVIVSSLPGNTVRTTGKQEYGAVEAAVEIARTQGPLGGIAVHDITRDYNHTEGNYLTVRRAIQTLNPSR